MEGVLLVISKSDHVFGELVLVGTEAHNEIFYFKPSGSSYIIGDGNGYYSNGPLDNGWGNLYYIEIASGEPDSTQYVVDDHTPLVFVEASGHGVGRLQRALDDDGDMIFIGGNSYDFYGGDGIVYYHDGISVGVPTGLSRETVAYELRALEELWGHRESVGSDETTGTTYCDIDTYEGSRGCVLEELPVSFGGYGFWECCAARPPWGWSSDHESIPRGEWFLDPVYVIPQHVEFVPGGQNDEYLQNHFLQVDKWFTVIQPAGEESYEVGVPETVRWEYNNEGQGPELLHVYIDISYDGETWEELASSVPVQNGSCEILFNASCDDCTLRIRVNSDCIMNISETRIVTVTGEYSIQEVKLYDTLSGMPISPLINKYVSVAGVVYIQPGTYSENGGYIMDETGGINYWASSWGYQHYVGYELAMTGKLWYDENYELYIGNPEVELLSSGHVTAPTDITIEHLVADYSHTGNYVRVTGAAHNVTSDSFILSQGGASIEVRRNSMTGVSFSDIIEGVAYTITSACIHGDGYMWLSPSGNDDIVLGVEEDDQNPGPDIIPTASHLYKCVPNPFNPSTKIRYDLSQPSQVDLKIFDLTGRLVCTLRGSTNESAGSKSLMWTGRDDNGRAAPAGLYIVRLETDYYRSATTVTLLK